jgi:Sulfotransferase family
LIEIVSCKKYDVAQDILHDFTLDLPREGMDMSKNPFAIMGWIVPGAARAREIQVHEEGRFVTSVPVNMPRPDVEQHFPGNFAGDKLGFCVYLNPFLLPTPFALDVTGIGEDGTRIKLYHIEGRSWLKKKPRSMKIRPLLINTLGRTGSTLFVSLLGAHPEIVAYRPFEAEARYLNYWLEIFFRLTDPKSWMQPMEAHDRRDPGWILGTQVSPGIHYSLYPEMFSWFHEEYATSVLGFCLGSLDRHYQNVARLLHKRAASYFCEKVLADVWTDRFRELVPYCKEIFLVRDFRDTFCSIRAFNEKMGFLSFSREYFSSDPEYLTLSLGPAARNLLEVWRRRANSAILVKYEDLVLDTERALKSLFQALGVDSSPAAIRYILRMVQGVDQKRVDSHMTASNGADSVGRFKGDLDPGLRQVCDQVFGEALEGFGYPL